MQGKLLNLSIRATEKESADTIKETGQEFRAHESNKYETNLATNVDNNASSGIGSYDSPSTILAPSLSTNQSEVFRASAPALRQHLSELNSFHIISKAGVICAMERMHNGNLSPVLLVWEIDSTHFRDSEANKLQGNDTSRTKNELDFFCLKIVLSREVMSILERDGLCFNHQGAAWRVSPKATTNILKGACSAIHDASSIVQQASQENSLVEEKSLNAFLTLREIKDLFSPKRPLQTELL